MTTTHSYRGVAWLDLNSPTEDEITGLVKRYGLHPFVGEELRRSSSTAKIDFYDNYFVAVLTIPERVKKGNTYEIAGREVDFVVGKNFLITSSEHPIEQLQYFGKIFETNSILNKDEKIEHAGYIFYYIVKRIYAGMKEDLENIRDALTAAEKNIFTGSERKMVEVLSNLSRELIDFRQAVRMHHEIWGQLTDSGVNSFSQDFVAHIHDMRNEFTSINELITNSRELLADLRQTNDSLLDTKQNDIVKLLTIVTFIFIPGTFIASIFTIPAIYVPIIGLPYGWAILMIATVLISAAIWLFFKKKNWV